MYINFFVYVILLIVTESSLNYSSISFYHAGTVVGIFAPPPIQASIKANIKSEFKAFTPSVKEEYFEWVI